MDINSATGLLENCLQCPSLNKDPRPDNTTIDLVVIHSISLPPGQYGGDHIESFFQNRLDANAHPYFKEIQQMKVSAHVLIKRNGTLVQFVPFHERAWHAGKSNYHGRDRCNDFSIGIELEGSDTEEFEERQYTQLTQLLQTLQSTYPEIKGHVTGHSDISPGRKSDPGSGFDWDRLKL